MRRLSLGRTNGTKDSPPDTSVPLPPTAGAAPAQQVTPELIVVDFTEAGPLGMSLRREAAETKVIRVIPGSQADRLRVKVGDVLIGVVTAEGTTPPSNFINFIAQATSRPIKITFSRTPAMRDRIQIGFQFDVLHQLPLDMEETMRGPVPPQSGWRWRLGEVLEIVPGRERIRVKFIDALGGTDLVDVGEDDCNIAPAGLKAPTHTMHHQFRSGDVLDVLDIFESKVDGSMKRKWRKCQVLSFSTYFIRVHFVGWDDKYDVWLHTLQQADRLAPFGLYTERAQVEESAREREFRAKLMEAGLEVVDVSPDGNCLFRAFALAVYGDQERHKDVRGQCCDFMEENANTFQHICLEGESFSDYVATMRCAATWGDDPEIRAMEMLYDRPVAIYSCDLVGSEKDRDCTVPITINFAESFPKGFDAIPIRVSFHGNNHYNFVRNVKGPAAPLLENPHVNAQRIRRFNQSSAGASPRASAHEPGPSLSSTTSSAAARASAVLQEVV